MITEFILHIIQTVLNFILTLFPSVDSMPTQIQSSLVFLNSAFQKANAFVPMDTIIAIGTIYLSVEGGILAFHFVNWIFNKLRGSG